MPTDELLNSNSAISHIGPVTESYIARNVIELKASMNRIRTDLLKNSARTSTRWSKKKKLLYSFLVQIIRDSSCCIWNFISGSI